MRNQDNRGRERILIGDMTISKVEKFKYFGLVIWGNGEMDDDIGYRIRWDGKNGSTCIEYRVLRIFLIKLEGKSIPHGL